MFQKHKRNFSTASLWGRDGGGGQKDWHDACLEGKWRLKAFLAESSTRHLTCSQIWAQTGSWRAKKQRVCLKNQDPAASSWALRAASSCWEAHPALIQSWSQSPRRRPTPCCLCGLCKSCCQKSSLSGCSLWPSRVHELWEQPHISTITKVENKWESLVRHHELPLIPCCSSTAFCFFRSSMSCWWVWFFRLMNWMYSVALSRICAREAWRFKQAEFVHVSRSLGMQLSLGFIKWQLSTTIIHSVAGGANSCGHEQLNQVRLTSIRHQCIACYISLLVMA